MGNILYFDSHNELDEKKLKKRFVVRTIIHYLYNNCVVISLGLIYKWFFFNRIDMVMAIVFMIFITYIVTWLTNFLRDKELAERLNDKLKEYYKKE